MERRSMNQILVGFLVAFFSITIVLGSFILTQAESKPHPAMVNSPVSLPQNIRMTGNPASEDTGGSALILTTPTAIQETPYCPVPEGWQEITVNFGDTLGKIAMAYHVTVETLEKANCLGTSTLLRGGQFIYVPNITPLQPSKTVKPTQKPPTSTPPTTESPVVTETEEPIPTESNE